MVGREPITFRLLGGLKLKRPAASKSSQVCSADISFAGGVLGTSSSMDAVKLFEQVYRLEIG